MADPVALGALMLDAAIGWPAPLYTRLGHPVGGIARIIGRLEARWNQRGRSSAAERMAGAATLAIVVALSAALAWACCLIADRVAGPSAWIVLAVLAWPGLAERSLDDHVRPVARALAAGDLAEARRRVAMIVGRDTAQLDAAGVARAAIESLAESFCDGVLAPLFWLVLLGVPGLWAYKAINTADSLIGHREERWRSFGWAAAKIDDVANYLPARIAGLVIGVAGGGRGLPHMPREAGKHASPNAGWPEAAMAGVLTLRLAGPIAYDGVVQDKPWIGTGRADAIAADVRRALWVYRRACLILWLMVGAITWAR
jgi:adenosylcobinamide-phosphate synthase